MTNILNELLYAPIKKAVNRTRNKVEDTFRPLVAPALTAASAYAYAATEFNLPLVYNKLIENAKTLNDYSPKGIGIGLTLLAGNSINKKAERIWPYAQKTRNAVEALAYSIAAGAGSLVSLGIDKAKNINLEKIVSEPINAAIISAASKVSNTYDNSDLKAIISAGVISLASLAATKGFYALTGIKSGYEQRRAERTAQKRLNEEKAKREAEESR